MRVRVHVRALVCVCVCVCVCVWDRNPLRPHAQWPHLSGLAQCSCLNRPQRHQSGSDEPWVSSALRLWRRAARSSLPWDRPSFSQLLYKQTFSSLLFSSLLFSSLLFSSLLFSSLLFSSLLFSSLLFICKGLTVTFFPSVSSSWAAPVKCPAVVSRDMSHNLCTLTIIYTQSKLWCTLDLYGILSSVLEREEKT